MSCSVSDVQDTGANTGAGAGTVAGTGTGTDAGTDTDAGAGTGAGTVTDTVADTGTVCPLTRLRICLLEGVSLLAWTENFRDSV